MSTGDRPAFPMPVDEFGKPCGRADAMGLTKREYAAIHIAAALAASPECASQEWSYQGVAERAWQQADVLFTALEQTQGGGS